ncbi:MAG: hypothetical protein ACRD3M_01230 [Thermoanaerobaculia bacterium]
MSRVIDPRGNDPFALICPGGAAGSGARNLVSGWALARLGVGFPRETLAVNVLGP